MFPQLSHPPSRPGQTDSLARRRRWDSVGSVPRPPSHPGAGSRPQWSRRSVLALALALSTGCTVSDPAVRGAGAGPASSVSPSPSPSPAPNSSGDLAAELRLAASAAAVAAGGTGPDGGRRAVLDLIQRAHQERAAALRAPDPTSRPDPASSPDPSPSASSPAPGAGLARLVEAERAAALRCRRAALATDGLSALLWGSMAVASTRFAAALEDADPPAVDRPRTHRPMALLSDTEAVSVTVSALHAAVYGYQVALGRLEEGSGAHTRAVAGRTGRRQLLDTLSDRLRDAGSPVPPAEPAYAPSPVPRDARTASALVRRLESGLLPYCGLWLAAAATLTDRRLALDTLTSTAATAQSWGAPLLVWPGWRD